MRDTTVPSPDPLDRRQALLRAAAALAALAALAACGKAARPRLPEGEDDQFPRQYPAADEV
jgi:hypothetical protein